MKRLRAFFAIFVAVAATALPAYAAQFVQDGAGMFSAGTVAQLEQRIGAFNAQTGKEIVVVTVPSLNGETRQQAAQTVFSEQRINGVLIFVAKAERQDIIVPGRATAQFFPASTTTQIRQAMEAQFRNGDFDGGITTAVNQTLDVFRAHLNTLPGSSTSRNYPAPASSRPVAVSNGVHLSMFWWIIIIVVGFLIIRSIFRAMSGPRYYGGPGGVPGGPMGPGGMPGGYGYGGPGYYGGGGGGFWSGLLGGLGGAWLGNELFNRNAGGGGYVDPNTGGGIAPADGGGNWGGNAPDPGGWGNDAGQADMGSSSGGDWGGGGFGGGDFSGGGGFGGGDSGGGGGDSGGGW